MEGKKAKILLILILIGAAIIRFYRLPEYLQFLGDQGRDLLVVKAMITEHKFTLLGPTASVGGFYTGPIYYYFMLPFLWLFQLDPIGPAIMSVFFGLGTIVLIYLFVREIFDEKAALLTSFLTAISPKMIDISRFSWNPNPVPFFSIAAIFLAYKRQILLSGVAVGILVQLHYIDLVMIVVIGIITLLLFKPANWVNQSILAIVGFIVGNSMFLLFELRHGFPNTKSVIEFVFRGGNTVAPRTQNFIELFVEIYRRSFETIFQTSSDQILNGIIYISLAVFAYFLYKVGKDKLIAIGVWLLIGMLGLGFYRGTLLDHYFVYLYPLPLIILGVVLTRSKFLFPVALYFVYLSVAKSYFWSQPNNLVQQTKNIDKVVADLVGGEDYNFALITPGNSDHAYRYFLEIWGKKPKVIYNPQIDPDRKSVASQLIVVCEGPCEPLGNPLWEVAGFGRAEISDKKEVPVGITVFKLVHYNKNF